jgi:hypothetical protein
LDGALLFDEKNRQSSALFLFGLQNDGILYLRAAIQRTIDISPAILVHGSAKKIACKPWSEQAGGLEAFLHEAAQNFEVVSNIFQNWNQKIKNL